jgi:hypothetical protein
VAFDDTWAKLQGKLFRSSSIPGWSAAGQARLKVVRILNVRDDYIEVETQSGNTQRVPKTKFKEVYDVWGAYCGGQLKRSTFNPDNRVSTYVISILHWLESQCGGQLP